MKLFKKKLLMLGPDPVPVGWPDAADEHQVLAVGASKRKYEGAWMFCATWFRKDGSPYARLFLGRDRFITYLFDSKTWTDKAIDRILQPGNSWSCLDNTPRMYLAEDLPRLLKACGKKRGYISEGNPLYLIEAVQRSMKSRQYAVADRRREEAAGYDVDGMQPPPPDDLLAVLRENGELSEVYLLFRSRTRRATKTRPRETYYSCRCTHCCGEYSVPQDIYYDIPQHNGPGMCPMCGRQGRHIELGRLRRPHVDSVSVLVFHRVEAQILAIGYTVERRICSSGFEETEVLDEDAFLFVPGRAIRYAKWWASYMGQKERLRAWDYRESIPADIWQRGRAMVYPIVPGLFDGTLLENAHVQLYLDECVKHRRVACPVRYCDQFLRYPGMENLLMQRFFAILQEKLEGSKAANRAVKWREVAPARMLELNRAEQRRLKWEHWDAETLLEYKAMRKLGWQMTQDDLGLWRAMDKAGISSLHLRAKTAERLTRYLRRQHERQPDQAYISIAATWKDYYEAGLALEYDFEDLAVLFPTRLGDAHDRTMDARRYAENPELYKQFADTAKKLMPLGWEHEGLCIRPAASEQELIAEGRVLAHCVGGYGRSHCEGKPIFFVRHASDPGLPYFTLQLDIKTKTVIQNRGHRNCARTEAVQAFESAWLAEVVARFDFAKGRFTPKKRAAANPAA